MTTTTTTRPELYRGVGLWAAIAVNVANMIGTGVFLKTRVMTCNVGTPGLVFTVWLAAGLLALAGTFSYSEIAAMMPEAGGDYVYLRTAYGRLTGFLYGWIMFTVARSGSQAALATIWSVALINCASVTAGGNWALVVTIAKVGLVAAVGVAALIFAPGSWEHLSASVTHGSCENVAPGARGGIVGFGAAMLGALWAYDGWNNVAPLAGEIRDPQKNLPRAFIGGTLVVMALYLFANLAYFHTLTPDEIASVSTTSSVATEVLKRFMGPAAVSLMAIALMVSSFGSLHASALANSRIPFAMARDGLFFRSLGELSPRSRVPVKAILAQATLGSLLAVSGSYDTLTDSVIFASWLFFGLSTGSLFVFRRTLPDRYRPYRALGYPWVPVLFLLATGALLVNTFFAAPRQALQGVAVLLAGLPLYWYWSRRGGTRGE